jgi:hypothetical protein
MSNQITGRPGGMKCAPADKCISGSPSFDPTDTVLRDIPKIAPGDIFCPPASAGAGTGKTTATAKQGKLP